MSVFGSAFSQKAVSVFGSAFSQKAVSVFGSAFSQKAERSGVIYFLYSHLFLVIRFLL